MKTKIAVLGSGAAGPALAADLISKGFEVNLADLPKFKELVSPFEEKGGIEMMGNMMGFFKPNMITTNIKDAIEEVDIIMLVARAFGHEEFVNACIPYLKNNQILMNWTPYWFCLRFVDIIREKTPEGVLLAEGRIYPFMVTRCGPTQIYLNARKATLSAAAMPSLDNKKVFGVLKELYPECNPAENVLETSLQNPNVSGHSTPTLLNTGCWERRHGDIAFVDLNSPGVGKVMDTQDKEKLEVGKALGVHLIPWPQVRVEQYVKYGAKGDTAYEAMRTTQSHQAYRPGGKLSEYKSIREDIPYGLVPLSSFGDMLNVPTPTIDALIQIGSIVCDTDYWNTGLTVDKLGLTDLTAKEIVKYVTTGKK